MDGVDHADAGGDGAALSDRRRQFGPDDRSQRHPGTAAVFPLPPPSPVAKARIQRRERRRPARGSPMTIGSDEAAAMLADVDSVVAKVKQSRIYRSAALIIMLWGAINLARDGLIALAPGWFGPRWFLVDAIGIAGTIVVL